MPTHKPLTGKGRGRGQGSHPEREVNVNNKRVVPFFSPHPSQLKVTFHLKKKPLASSTKVTEGCQHPSTLSPTCPLGRVFKHELGFQPYLGHLPIPSSPLSIPACQHHGQVLSDSQDPGRKSLSSPRITCSAAFLLRAFGEDAPASPSFSIRIQLPPPTAAAAPSSPPWKNAPLPHIPPQGESGREAAYGPILLGLGRLFWK